MKYRYFRNLSVLLLIVGVSVAYADGEDSDGKKGTKEGIGKKFQDLMETGNGDEDDPNEMDADGSESNRGVRNSEGAVFKDLMEEGYGDEGKNESKEGASIKEGLRGAAPRKNDGEQEEKEKCGPFKNCSKGGKQQVNEKCGPFNKCASGLSCHPGAQKCYNVPRLEGQPCVPRVIKCSSGLVCEEAICYSTGMNSTELEMGESNP